MTDNSVPMRSRIASVLIEHPIAYQDYTRDEAGADRWTWTCRCGVTVTREPGTDLADFPLHVADAIIAALEGGFNNSVQTMSTSTPVPTDYNATTTCTSRE